MSRFQKVALLLTFAFAATFALGQSSSGTITGIVTDSQGAVLVNAPLTVTNTGKSRAIEVKTNGEGLYSLPGLEPGQYRVEVKQTGFKAEVREVTLQTAQVINLDFALQPGSATESVEVTAATPIIDTASSGVSDTVAGRQIVDLPLNGRNFTDLATLVPGVTRGQPGNQQTGTGNQAETFRYATSGGGALSVNGLRVQANNYLFDGIDNNESLVNTIVFFVPPDAIQEFRVDTNVAQAEYGRAGGGVVNATYKSGTNDYHGTVFWQHREDGFDANPNYFSHDKRPSFHRNQFGFAAGGPIIKNKLFIFGDYQAVRQKLPLAGETATVPTDLERSGNFSQFPNQLYLPGATSLATRVPVPGNDYNGVLSFIPAGQNYLKAYPEPNITSGGDSRCTLTGTDGSCLENNYQAHRVQQQNYNDFDVRLDYVFRAADQAFVRYSYGQDIDNTTPRLPTLPSGYGSGVQFQHPRSIVIGETHIFGSSLINEFRLGYVRSFLGYEAPFGAVPLAQQLGIPNANTSPLLGGGALIGNSGSQLEYTGDYGNYFVPENTYQVADNFSWVRGRHTFKFGANVIWRQVNFFNPIAGKGFFQADASKPWSTGFEQSDLLVGWINNYQVGPSSGYFHTRSWEDGFYGQDDWRVSNRLTLNLGLRYDVFTWPTEINNRMANFDLTTGHIVLAGQNGVSKSTLSGTNHNFAPRVGFAYDLRGDRKTVVRGGYGIFYFIDREGIDKQLSQNAPFGGSASYNYQNALTNNGYFVNGSATFLTLGGPAQANANGTPDVATLSTSGFPNKQTLNIDLNNPANVSLTAWLPKNRTSMVQQWNVQVQQQLDSKTAATLAYVGTHGTRLSTFYDINRPAYNTGVKLYPALGTIPVNDTRGGSVYHGLQAMIRRQLSNGIQFNGSYTWSHSIDNSVAGFDSDYRYGGNVVDPFQWWTKERASSLQDVRHRFVFNALVELPFGRGKMVGNDWNRATDALLGGWQLSPIVTLASGFPFDVICQYCYGPSTRPELIGPLQQLNHVREWFNVNAFAKVPTSGTGTPIAPGSGPRNPFTGPATKTMDLSIGKTFRITERFSTELRGEFFNLFNTPQFNQPDGNLNDASICGADGMFNGHPCVPWTIFDPGKFGKVTSLRFDSQREVQLSLRVSF
jgi:hypothetical protein